MLHVAVTKAHSNIVASTWSNDEAKQYLWVYGLSNDAVFLEDATNEKMFNCAELNKDTTTREYIILKHHTEQFPKRYNQWMYPAS
jgi:hypothetical protein